MFLSIMPESHSSHFRRLFYGAVKKPAILFSIGAPVSGWFINALYSLIEYIDSLGNKVMCCLDHSAIGVKTGLSQVTG